MYQHKNVREGENKRKRESVRQNNEIKCASFMKCRETACLPSNYAFVWSAGNTSNAGLSTIYRKIQIQIDRASVL